MNHSILLTGVGGQGVLTIAEIVAQTALRLGLPASLYPTKGMAQRGGFVRAQVRLGEGIGPAIPERGADLVIGMEVSESLKGARYAKPGGEFFLWGHVWLPTRVMLGREEYPPLEQVLARLGETGARVWYLDPATLPQEGGSPLPANIYVLGAVVGHTGLGRLLPPDEVAEVVRTRWKRGGERNRRAFQAGLTAPVQEVTP